MNLKRITATLSLIAFILPFLAQGQDEGFIYGTVTTIDNKEYTGAIRWGKEEVFWTDMFNGSKEENENLSYLSRSERDELDERKYSGYNRSYENKLIKWINEGWNEDREDEHTHQFSVQFGEIAKIEITGRSRVYVTLRNGEKIEVNGQGFNDIGASIRVLDAEIGEIKLNWSKIDQIEFRATPSKLSAKFGEPLYGSVVTYNGTYEGYIQWDHDERVDSDKLDGDTSDGDVSIAFGKIQEIANDGNRANIKLNSGREMTLRGSNDVNSSNRGIIVSNDAYGRVDIPWREFRQLSFSSPKGKMPSYGDFKTNNKLSGVVKTKSGKSYKGKIAYDLDESYEMEVLQGKEDDIEYIIPFRNISSVTPKNYDYSIVTLKNGEQLTLGESQDVSDKNSGILIFEGSGDPVYVVWEEIEKITFN